MTLPMTLHTRQQHPPLHRVCEPVMPSQVTGKPQAPSGTPLNQLHDLRPLMWLYNRGHDNVVAELAKGPCPLTHIVCKTGARNNQSP